MGGTHALLSPSAASRWLNCPAAPRLEERVEDQSSEFAEEGTLAHAYCSAKLKEFLGLPTTSEAEEIAELNEKYHTGEMDEYTDTYKTIVLEKFNAARALTKDAQLLIETRLDFGKFIPEAFGTADAIIIADGTLEIIDFKYGKGVKVLALDNPQMKIYALGAYERFNFEYDLKRIRMTIAQPRLDNLSESEETVADLLTWATEELSPKAQLAFTGEGQQDPWVWCRFCKVKSNCRALSLCCSTAAQDQSDPKLLTPEEIASKLLPILPVIKSWVSSVEEYAKQLALSGVELPGWKLVEGKSNRIIVDPEGVLEALNQQGYTEADIYKPQEMRSLTELEKLVGKKTFNILCSDFITKPQGKPTLAAESDKRTAINPAADDFKEIKF